MSAVASSPPGGGSAPLPRLREDLRVELVSEDGRSLPSAIVSDLVRSSYFRLPWPESGIFLALQCCGSMAAVLGDLSRRFGMAATADDVQRVVEFALANQLTENGPDGSWQRLATQHAARKRKVLASALHAYLFFRVPLYRPQARLQRMLPWLEFVYAGWFWGLIAAVGLAGAYLALRQWSEVAGATAELMRVETLTVYAVAILGLKAIHELGHALTTVRFGCRVPSVGVAFMFGAPILYTDTSDSWRLSSRRDRIAIVMAGVAAETIVAVAALLSWCFLPDGLARTICFALATASIAMTFAVNLNPFMRFDGYFALSDYLGVANLQNRAFALGLWRLRETLFDVREPPPEALPVPLARLLIRYAFVTALYRLVLYLGIAAMVYAVAGKAVGILLAGIEIIFLVLRPIVQEMAVWWGMREKIARRARGWRTVAVVALLLLGLVVPWLTTVGAPAMLVAEQEEAIHLPFPARLVAIHVGEGRHVEAGDVLFTATAADLDRDMLKAMLERRGLAAQVARLVSSDKEREFRGVLESRLARTSETIAAIERRLEQLVIRAPFAGRIVDLDPEISSGIWLDGKRPLARLVVADRSRARGMIAETDVARIVEGARAVFIPDDPAEQRQLLKVERIAPAADGRFAEPALASRHGGNVAAGENSREIIARQGQFEVTFETFDRPTPRVSRGIARIDADPISPLALAWRAVARVLTREQGF